MVDDQADYLLVGLACRTLADGLDRSVILRQDACPRLRSIAAASCQRAGLDEVDPARIGP